MNKYTKTLLACAAIAGLYAGAAAAWSYAADDKTAGQAAPTDSTKDKSSCGGKDGCSGKADAKATSDTKGASDTKAAGASDKAKSSCNAKSVCNAKDTCSAKADTKNTPKPKEG